MMEFESRAIRSLLELHEAELRSFLATWRRYARAGVPMPEAHGDEDYESIDRLGTHVLKASRNFLVRITEWLGRPAADLDMTEDVDLVRTRDLAAIAFHSAASSPAQHRDTHAGCGVMLLWSKRGW